MDAALPLRDLVVPDHLTALLPGPFTPSQARAAGVDRPALERLVRAGQVRRLLRGVYAGTAAPDDRAMRARALALLVDDTVVVGETAAWLHGVDAGPHAGRAAGRAAGERWQPRLATAGSGGRGSSRRLSPEDVEEVEGVRVTTPLRTALDLGKTLTPARALAVLDAFLSSGQVEHAELLAQLPRMAGHPGVGSLRVLVAQADGRAATPAESVLRLRWHDARLPTAVPGMTVAAGGRVVRMALGVERCQFGAVLHESVRAEELVALEGAGWRVVLLCGRRVLEGEAELVMRHLEREFHQHLLGQIS